MNPPHYTRRQTVSALGTTALVALAGCSSSDTETTGTSAGSSASTGTSGYGASAGADALGFEIDYFSEWSASVSADGDQQSIDGYGTREGNINPAPNYAGITAQKQEESGTLTVRFYYDGQVVDEGSTSAAYGVVTVTVTA